MKTDRLEPGRISLLSEATVNCHGYHFFFDAILNVHNSGEASLV